MALKFLSAKISIRTRISEAAKEHARQKLGDDQFRVNDRAVKSITSDFKAGIAWFQSDKRKKSINRNQ